MKVCERPFILQNGRGFMPLVVETYFTHEGGALTLIISPSPHTRRSNPCKVDRGSGDASAA